MMALFMHLGLAVMIVAGGVWGQSPVASVNPNLIFNAMQEAAHMNGTVAPTHSRGGASQHNSTAAGAHPVQHGNQTSHDDHGGFGQIGKGLAGNDPSGNRGFQANGATQAGGPSNAGGKADNHASVFGEKNDAILAG